VIASGLHTNVTPRQHPPILLNHDRLAVAAQSVAVLDDDMARILETLGTPPLWDRPPGFVTLLRIILEQQVSLVSADAMYRRLLGRIDPLTPENVLAKGESFLRSFGLTRQKAAYFVNVARAIHEGDLDLDALSLEDDETAMALLTSIKGIGPWTARIYLLMVLCRPDVWPVGDVALATAFQKLKKLEKRPSQPELEAMALAWAPHRATAARLLWHYYLNGMPGEIGKRQ
jgi:DNA-3-methyladenine glycosylase II